MTLTQVLKELTTKKYRVKLNDDGEYNATFFAAYNNSDHTAIVSKNKNNEYKIEYLNRYEDI